MLKLLVLAIQHKLTNMLEGDSNVLGGLYRNCKDAREKIRYAALYAISRGNNVKNVANIIAVEESTVYGWIHRWGLLG